MLHNHLPYRASLVLVLSMLPLYMALTDKQCHANHTSGEQSGNVNEIFIDACKLLENHQPEKAITKFKEVQKKSPSLSQAYYNCGIAYRQLNNIDCALTQFQKAFEHNPSYVKAYTQAGLLYVKQNKIIEAVDLFKKAIVQDPYCIQAHVELARIYCDQENLEQATLHLEQALIHGIPENSDLAFSISLAMATVGKPSEMVRILEQLHTKQPDNPAIMQNLSFAYKTLGNYDKSVKLLNAILKLYPNREETQFALGHTWLEMGNFKQGWIQHDRFLLRTNRYCKELKDWIRKGTLKGKHILLCQEGGLGDTIQWIRCAQQLKDAGAIVIVYVPQCLIKLLSRCPYIDRLIASGDTNHIPHTDAHATIMSLPAILELQEPQMATHIPYILPDQELVDYWGLKLVDDKHFKIGLCWQADSANDARRLPFSRRSIPLKTISLLGSISGASFYSLQINCDAKQITDVKDKLHIITFDDDFDQSHGAFMDTAAIMEHMDLIITVDTAIAHLAGAMGKPVWLMLPYQTDWRWIAHRTDSPWYPSMRIFKQQNPFDWDTVALQIYQALRDNINN